MPCKAGHFLFNAKGIGQRRVAACPRHDVVKRTPKARHGCRANKRPRQLFIRARFSFRGLRPKHDVLQRTSKARSTMLRAQKSAERFRFAKPRKTLGADLFRLGGSCRKNLFISHDNTNRTKENHPGGSPLFVFYPGKAVFGIIVPRILTFTAHGEMLWAFFDFMVALSST